MRVEIVILVLITLITFAFGFSILRKRNRKESSHIILFYEILFQLVWTLTILFTLVFFDVPFWNLFFSRSSFASAVGIAIFFCMLSAQFYQNKSKKIYYSILGLGFIWIILSYSNLVLKEVIIRDGKIVSHLGFIQPLYTLTLGFIFIYSFYLLRAGFREANDINLKEQLKYIIVGGATSVALSIGSNLILPLYGIEIRSLGPLSLLIFIGATFYAITRHRFLKLNVAFGDMILVLSLSIFPFSIFYIVYEANTRLWGSIYSIPAYISGLIESALFISILLRLQKFINTFIDKFIRYDFVRINKLISSFETELQQEIDLKDILKKTNELLNNILKSNDYVLVNSDDKNITYYLQHGERIIDTKSILYAEKAIKFLSKNFLDVSELINNNDKLYVELNKRNIELVYPLKNGNYLVLLTPSNNKAYTSFEIQNLYNISQVLGVAIQRAALYDQQRSFNAILQSKVDSATKKLRQQKSELQEKYQFEKDMMGIMGHELRTPMTVAKGMTELVIEKIKNNQLDPAYAVDKLQKIYTSIIKEADLIQTMLSTSHIDNNKMNLQISKVKLDDVVSYSYMAFKKDAKEKGLEMVYVKPDFAIPEIDSDPSRIQEVVNNLVSNAVKYTQQGSVKIFFTIDSEFIYVNVQDTGIGIPAEEVANLGKKFYRVNQYLDANKQVVRSGGTGLGIYVVKGLLNALGGELRIVSEVNKGSTFTAVLPIIGKFKDNVFITNRPVDHNDMFQELGFNITENRRSEV